MLVRQEEHGALELNRLVIGQVSNFSQPQFPTYKTGILTATSQRSEEIMKLNRKNWC